MKLHSQPSSWVTNQYKGKLTFLICIVIAQAGFCTEINYNSDPVPQADYVQYAKNGYYLGVNIGLSPGLSFDDHTKSEDAVVGIPYILNANTTIKFGRKLGKLRSELEFSHFVGAYFVTEFMNETHKIKLPNMSYTSSNGDFIELEGQKLPIELPTKVKNKSVSLHNLFLFDVNFYYDFTERFGPITPYVGIGFGYIGRQTIYFDSATVEDNDDKRSKSGGTINLQLMLGSETNITKKFAFTSEWKIIYLPDPEGFTHAMGLMYNGFNFRYDFGCVYRFG